MSKDIGRRFTVRLNPLDEQHAIILDYFAKLEQDKPGKRNKFLIDCILKQIEEERFRESADPERKVSYRELVNMKAELETMIKDEIIKILTNGIVMPIKQTVIEEKDNQSNGEISDAALAAIASWD